MKSNLQKFGITTLSSAVFLLFTLFLRAEGGPVKASYAKKIVDENATPDVDVNAVNKRAFRDFQRTYPSIANVNWYHTEDGGWLAIFDDGSVRTVAAYNHGGLLNHTIRYYDESKLSKDVRGIAKSVYYDFKINRVANIILPDPQANEIYMLYMESETELKVVTIAGREIVQVRDYVKGN